MTTPVENLREDIRRFGEALATVPFESWSSSNNLRGFFRQIFNSLRAISELLPVPVPESPPAEPAESPESVEAGLRRRVQLLESSIRTHREQKGDDRCWLDDLELYKVLGDDVVPDNRVGCKEAMLKNCERFLKNRCEDGGPWKTYAELEAELAATQRDLEPVPLAAPLDIMELPPGTLSAAKPPLLKDNYGHSYPPPPAAETVPAGFSVFQSYPATVVARQYRGQDIPGVTEWDEQLGVHFVTTIHNQPAHLRDGDWIIQEPDRQHYYPCMPDIFDRRYFILASP